MFFFFSSSLWSNQGEWNCVLYSVSSLVCQLGLPHHKAASLPSLRRHLSDLCICTPTNRKEKDDHILSVVTLCVSSSQCLQRTWARVSCRWRGSCCSWRRTWRRSPATMTRPTCSSPKWLYPSDALVQSVDASGRQWTGFTASVSVQRENSGSKVQRGCRLFLSTFKEATSQRISFLLFLCIFRSRALQKKPHTI